MKWKKEVKQENNIKNRKYVETIKWRRRENILENKFEKLQLVDKFNDWRGVKDAVAVTLKTFHRAQRFWVKR